MTEQERKNMVARAAEAMFELEYNRKPTGSTNDAAILREFVAGAERVLLAAGAIPAAKVPTEGERIADEMVRVTPKGIEVWHPEKCGVIRLAESPGMSRSVDFLREYIAAAVDGAARPALPAVDVEGIVADALVMWRKRSVIAEDAFRYAIRRARGEAD